MDNVHVTIDRALEVTGGIVQGVDAEQWQLPTCCPDWDARAVTNHLVGGFTLLANSLRTGRLAGDFDDDWLGADPVAAYRTAAQRVSSAWQRPGGLDAPVLLTFGTVPGRLAAVIHLTEVVVHGLDIAEATGQQELDEELCADLLRTMKELGIDSFRVPGIFGPEVSVDDPHAPVHRQLMAYSGRRVAANDAPVPAGR